MKLWQIYLLMAVIWITPHVSARTARWGAWACLGLSILCAIGEPFSPLLRLFNK